MKRGGPQHPKVRRLAKLLGIPRAHAVGLIEGLFHFTAKYAPDGDIGRWGHAEIAEDCGWEGDPEVFIEALINATGGDSGCGFVERSTQMHTARTLLVHDWPEHADDAVHMHMARAGKRFADGSSPRLSRFSKKDRKKLQDAVDTNVKKDAHAVHTPCASSGTQKAHRPPLPSPPPPCNTNEYAAAAGSNGDCVGEPEQAKQQEADKEVFNYLTAKGVFVPIARLASESGRAVSDFETAYEVIAARGDVVSLPAVFAEEVKVITALPVGMAYSPPPLPANGRASKVETAAAKNAEQLRIFRSKHGVTPPPAERKGV